MNNERNLRFNNVCILFQNTTQPNCHKAVLVLSKISNSDIGEYTLIVRSASGLSEGIINVNVTYASNFVEHSNGHRMSHHFVIIYINVIVLLLVKVLLTDC